MGLTLVVDANNFYAGCEEIFAPSLRGKALAVLSSNDGNSIARSQACKDLCMMKIYSVTKNKTCHSE